MGDKSVKEEKKKLEDLKKRQIERQQQLRSQQMMSMAMGHVHNPAPGRGMVFSLPVQQQHPHASAPAPALVARPQMVGPPGSLRRLGAPTGPNLERTRFTEEIFHGKIIEWKGKFGWIQATDHIKHPMAVKHGGKIYINQQDVVDDDVLGSARQLMVGQTVQFLLYSDASGVGAEHCQAREASALRCCGVWQRAREGHTQTTQRACSERALSEFACDRQRCNSQTSLAIGVKIACHR